MPLQMPLKPPKFGIFSKNLHCSSTIIKRMQLFFYKIFRKNCVFSQKNGPLADFYFFCSDSKLVFAATKE